MRQVYLAATGQNRGKTTTSIGLLDGFLRRGLDTRFMKPVGQRTVIEDGVPADEDAILVRNVFGLADPLTVMSPVHIPRGFTKAYINGEIVEDLSARIRAAHAAVSRAGEILLIEGTGHAGVGAVIGLSNAAVGGDARRARRSSSPRAASAGRSTRSCSTRRTSPATACGSPGRSSTRSTSTPSRASSETLERGLALHDIPLLGVLPYRPILSNPTLAMILEGVHGETVHPGPRPRPGDRRRGDRGDGAGAHARADPARHPGDRARRSRGRDPDPDHGPPDRRLDEAGQPVEPPSAWS